MVKRKSQKGKQEMAQHSLRCHKSRGNRLKELEASKHSSSWAILSNRYTRFLRAYFIHNNREKQCASQDVFLNKQSNKYLHRRSCVSRWHPTEWHCYFKAPKQLSCWEGARSVGLASATFAPGPTHSFLARGNHCICLVSTRTTPEDRRGQQGDWGLWSTTALLY